MAFVDKMNIFFRRNLFFPTKCVGIFCKGLTRDTDYDIMLNAVR